MKNSGLSLPEQRNYEYSLKLTLEVAREQLSGITDIARQCQKCGADIQITDSAKIIMLSYLNRICRISLPDMEVHYLDNHQVISSREKLLILHYFLHAGGISLSHRMVSFKELPETKNYFRTFHRRAIQPILNAFGKEPDRLLSTALLYGGRPSSYGDIAVTIDAFPRVPVTFVLWKGDDEFPSDANLLFDSTVTDYLPAEDIIVLSEIVTWKLVQGVGK